MVQLYWPKETPPSIIEDEHPMRTALAEALTAKGYRLER
jgi:hypothetical protein